MGSSAPSNRRRRQWQAARLGRLSLANLLDPVAYGLTLVADLDPVSAYANSWPRETVMPPAKAGATLINEN